MPVHHQQLVVGAGFHDPPLVEDDQPVQPRDGRLVQQCAVGLVELAAQGIRVNSVCPAGMPTNFIPGLQTSDAAKASMGATHPLGRPIDPMDCANAALFLACDLSSNITGVNLPVDGGLSAGVPPRR